MKVPRHYNQYNDTVKAVSSAPVLMYREITFLIDRASVSANPLKHEFMPNSI
jgi:hypothetical protein